MPRLITIPISHYGERARWALQYAGIAFEESHHLQFFSWVAAYAHGRSKMVPLLVQDDGQVLTDSAAIVRWASERAKVSLYPEQPAARAEVVAMEAEFHDYGVETRRVTYSWFLAEPRPLLPFNEGRAPGYQKLFFRAALPAAKPLAKTYLKVHPAELERGVAVLARVHDQVAARLSDGRRYLFGDAFTAADLTFASMAAAVLVPAEYGVPLPSHELAPEPIRGKLLELREHPACQFALRVYREDRSRVVGLRASAG